jgi:hypothetical protein
VVGTQQPSWSRILSWALVTATAALVVAAVVLELVAKQRGYHLQYRWSEQMILVGGGGAYAVLSAAVGLLIASSEPRNVIAWLFLGGAVMLAANLACTGYSDFAIYGGMPWPATAWTAAYTNWSFIPALFVGPALVAQLFPNGQPLPGRWRWVFWLTVAIGLQGTLWSILHGGPMESYPERTNPLGLPGSLGRVAAWLDDNGSIAALPVFSASVTALVVRFRRSRGSERQQMKVIAYAGALPLVVFGLAFTVGLLGADGWGLDALFLAGLLLLMLIPAGVGVAIRRYRLYEVDRVISRTLVYGSLTVVLGAAYVGLVLAGQAVFSSFAGGSNLAIAASTLVVAALFLPLRARLQQVVDRRFNRRRYDAQQTLAAFSTCIRHQVELGGLCAELQAVIESTVQPVHISVWLRETR